MSIIKQHKTTSVFVSLIIIAGICNLLNRTPNALFNTLMFCVNFMIYIGLIIFWAQSIRGRLLPTKSRAYMFASSLLMILYLCSRVFKYRIVADSVIVLRYTVYIYFIPLIMIPSLMLATSVDISITDSRISGLIGKAVLVVGGVVSLIPVTNDYHHFVYVPAVDLSAFDMNDNTYTWGPAFYAVYAWIIATLAVGVVMLLRVFGKKGKKTVIMLAGVIVIWVLLSLLDGLVFSRFLLRRPYFKAETDCFCMLLFFECCIRSRLIPFNEKYRVFFENIKQTILITDSDLNIEYITDKSVDISPDALKKAKTEPCYLDAETRLSSMKIRAGYVFWIENEHELREQRKKLAEANELLSEENDLISVENKLKEQKARIEAQDQVYERITAAIYPKQKRIEEILNGVDPDSSDFSEALGKTCVLNAFSKRKTNLLLLSEVSLPESNRELFLALAESCRFLKCIGIDAAAVGEEYSGFTLKEINDIYDTFETVIETYINTLSRMTVSILPYGVRIAMEVRKEMMLPDTVLPVECKESDGILFLTIFNRTGGGLT